MRFTAIGTFWVAISIVGSVRAQVDENFSLDEEEEEGEQPPPSGERDFSLQEGDQSSQGIQEGTGFGQDDGTAPGRIGDEQVLIEERLGVEEARSSTDPYEDPDDRYMFLGFFYRHTWTPLFMLNLFMDESTPTSNPSFGLEFTYRRGGFDIIGTLWYQRYFVDGPFRAAGDPVEDIEFFDSNLQAVFAGATFLWSTDFNKYVGIQYGVGVGVGVTIGDMVRTEAYPNDGENGARVVRGHSECAGPGMELATSPVDDNHQFCGVDGPVADGEEGEHYGAVARRWSQGGTVPNVWFRAAVPHLALRIKPVAQLMMRVDFGFDILSGFFLGSSLAYGF